MLIGNKVRLQPDKTQEEQFIKFTSTARFAWNESKAYYEEVYREEHRLVTLKDLMKHMQDLKNNNPEYAWIRETPEAVTKQEMKDLLRAYHNYFKQRDPKNPDTGRPRFKKKGRCTVSFYQRTDNIHKTDDTHIKITGIRKPVKCKALKDKQLPQRIQNPRVTHDGKYWYLSYSYEEDPIRANEAETEALGIDLGVKDLAVFSSGEHYRNINTDETVIKLRKRLKHLQRKVSRKYEANCEVDAKGKKLFHKTKNIIKTENEIRLIYRKIRNIQNTYMHSVVNAAVRAKPAVIIMEDLDIAQMMQSPRLAGMIQEERLYEFRRIMAYKCERYGISFITADRYYPSSQICSECGNRKKDLKLNERIYRCECCGLVKDRDENAAVNLKRYPEYKRITRN